MASYRQTRSKIHTQARHELVRPVMERVSSRTLLLASLTSACLGDLRLCQSGLSGLDAAHMLLP